MGRAARWIRRTTFGCVTLLALIAEIVPTSTRTCCRAARAGGLDCGADAAIGGRNDRGGFDYAAGRVAVG